MSPAAVILLCNAFVGLLNTIEVLVLAVSLGGLLTCCVLLARPTETARIAAQATTPTVSIEARRARRSQAAARPCIVPDTAIFAA